MKDFLKIFVMIFTVSFFFRSMRSDLKLGKLSDLKLGKMHGLWKWTALKSHVIAIRPHCNIINRKESEVWGWWIGLIQSGFPRCIIYTLHIIIYTVYHPVVYREHVRLYSCLILFEQFKILTFYWLAKWELKILSSQTLKWDRNQLIRSVKINYLGWTLC